MIQNPTRQHLSTPRDTNTLSRSPLLRKHFRLGPLATSQILRSYANTSSVTYDHRKSLHCSAYAFVALLHPIHVDGRGLLPARWRENHPRPLLSRNGREIRASGEDGQRRIRSLRRLCGGGNLRGHREERHRWRCRHRTPVSGRCGCELRTAKQFTDFRMPKPATSI